MRGRGVGVRCGGTGKTLVVDVVGICDWAYESSGKDESGSPVITAGGVDDSGNCGAVEVKPLRASIASDHLIIVRKIAKQAGLLDAFLRHVVASKIPSWHRGSIRKTNFLKCCRCNY